MRYLLSGAAAVALAASGALAQPGNGNGKDSGDRGKPAAASMKQVNGNGNGNSAKRDREPNRAVERDRAPDASRQRDAKAEKSERRVATPSLKAEKREINSVERDVERRVERRVETRSGDSRNRDGRLIDRVVFNRDRELLRLDRSRDLIDGCPPGLRKKNNGCLPPGQAKKQYADRGLFGYDYRPGLFGLSSYSSGRYMYNDGYLLRLGSGGGIGGYIPLLGGALSIGNPWPSSYTYNRVPDYYVDYYNLGGSDRYRYADNVIYRVDPEDAAILSVAALLTGDEFSIGQPMPSGYDVYNVPYAYRDRYYDTPEASYRYSDGYVYRVDPKTQLVAAAIDLLI
ncbi:hypothetical protein [Qipengyuania zhejiangensis]|uniref:hypothetical protein n=1 Tax=Qipengyuania zhejiangensis TaxID=3077782 RepID=UPI002D77E8A4|nr:hypothetical protein [Qipengyuania sp. Z2]